MKKSDFISITLRSLLYIAAFFTVAVIIFIIAHILINGLPHINRSLFARKYTSENVEEVICSNYIIEKTKQKQLNV